MKKSKALFMGISMLGTTLPSIAQWNPSGNNISNTNSGNVGIGTTSPAYKLDVNGTFNLDNGGGTGTIMRLRVNNGYATFYADASSDLHFAGRMHVDQAFFPDGGLAFNSPGAGISLNSGPVTGVSNLTFNSSGSFLKLPHDYNGYSPVADQGIIVMYSNRNAGIYPRAAIQVYKNGDPTENPFLISSQGFGWLKNSKTDEVAWILKGAVSQTADLQQWQNSSGTVLSAVNKDGYFGIGTSAPTAKLEVNGNTKIITGNPGSFTVGNTVGSNHLSYDGSTGTTSFYLLKAGNFRTETNGESQIRGEINNRLLFVNGAYIAGYQSPVTIKRVWSGVGNATLILDDEGGVSPSTYKVLQANFGGSEVSYINGNGDAFFNGKMKIATANFPATGNYKLAVGGDIIAEKVRVKLQSSGWPDYVFDPAYNLPTLKETELFIRQNLHLPGVPSAATIEKEGLDLGDGQAVLLKKIEEMTLHMIEMNKRMEKLEKENEELKSLLKK